MPNLEELVAQGNVIVSIIIVSAERRLLLALGLSQRLLSAFRRISATFTRSSVHLVGGLPTMRLPVRGVTSNVHRPLPLKFRDSLDYDGNSGSFDVSPQFWFLLADPLPIYSIPAPNNFLKTIKRNNLEQCSVNYSISQGYLVRAKSLFRITK